MERYKKKFSEGLGKVELSRGIMGMYRITDIPIELLSKLRIGNFSSIGIYAGDFIIFDDDNTSTFELGFSRKDKRQIMFNYINKLMRK